MKSFNDIKANNTNISGLFYIKQSLFLDFNENKKNYENERNMFCEKSFLDQKEINNSLLVNNVNYQYIDRSSFSINFEEEEDYFEEEEDEDDEDVIDRGKKHLVDSDDSSDVISSDEKK